MHACLCVCIMFLMVGQTAGLIGTKLGTRDPGIVLGKSRSKPRSRSERSRRENGRRRERQRRSKCRRHEYRGAVGAESYSGGGPMLMFRSERRSRENGRRASKSDGDGTNPVGLRRRERSTEAKRTP